MKLQVLQEDFSKAINTAARFTSSRAQLPILGNILLSASQTKLSIASTNLEISISISVGAQVEKEGEITIPSRVVSDQRATKNFNPRIFFFCFRNEFG